MSFKPFKYALLAAGFGSAALLPFWSFAESAPAPKRERTEIHFSADQVEENSETKVITATGNVNIVREGTTLKADKITYDRKNDKITADGHVNIIQPDGTTVFADSAELEDKMSKGAIHEVKTYPGSYIRQENFSPTKAGSPPAASNSRKTKTNISFTAFIHPATSAKTTRPPCGR